MIDLFECVASVFTKLTEIDVEVPPSHSTPFFLRHCYKQ